MSRKWLLFSFCLSVLLTLAPLSRANLTLRVNESVTRVLFEEQDTRVLLAVENSLGRRVSAHLKLELVDTDGTVRAAAERDEQIKPGANTIATPIGLWLSGKAATDTRELLWYRLRYRITSPAPSQFEQLTGLISLSEITPDIFALSVATQGKAQPGAAYRLRVRAAHPLTSRAVAGVDIGAEIKFEGARGDILLKQTARSDASGFATLDFQIPRGVEGDEGDLTVTGRRGLLTESADSEVKIDRYAQVMVSTDKPLYQPGQTLHARILMFDGSRHALADQKATLKISDPESTTAFRTEVNTSRFGVANADWAIPENTRLGNYLIEVDLDGDKYEEARGAAQVKISRYDLPNFTVNVKPDRTYYLANQDAEVEVRADYLFGQPVKRGHVRVVRETERQWNYREQKYDTEEGDKYEGDVDSEGRFVAHIKLGNEHQKLKDEDYSRYRDLSYAAYFTDSTTNRTEQRRFDLRLTKNAIHIYVVAGSFRQAKDFPLEFYVTASYADGTPAGAEVTISRVWESRDSRAELALRTTETNKYGIAKVSGLILPKDQDDDDSEVSLMFRARDGKGARGEHAETLTFSHNPVIRVETDKTLYRDGEPIRVEISASQPDTVLAVDAINGEKVLQSQLVHLQNGRASLVLPYGAGFSGPLTIAAYSAAAQNGEDDVSAGTRTVLYPHDRDLKFKLDLNQETYKPGEEASANFLTRTATGRVAESALGVVIFDKAVEERARTDSEFGSGYGYGFYGAYCYLSGCEGGVAGVTRKDLDRLDLTKPLPEGLALVAEMLLTDYRFSPRFFHSESYDAEPAHVFADFIKYQVEPLKDRLDSEYRDSCAYPNDEIALRRFASLSGIAFDELRDPWETPYRASFFAEDKSDVFQLESAGADKQFDTADDFTVMRIARPYFRFTGEAIDRSVARYHARTGQFIRDAGALRSELQREGIDFAALRDPWGQPYQLEFGVSQTKFQVLVRSSGPDRQFSSKNNDDVMLWTSAIDYSTDVQAQVESALVAYFKATAKIPQDDGEFDAALKHSGISRNELRDPWGRPYYATFKQNAIYGNRVTIFSYAKYGEKPKEKTELTPVTQQMNYIYLRSEGEDGKEGTADDFNVASFSRLVAEQAGSEREQKPISPGVVLPGSTGAITGTVTDPNGAVVAGATVTAKNKRTSVEFSATSDDNGVFLIRNVPAGTYEVRIQSPGFQTFEYTDVPVRSSNITRLDASLSVAATSATVNVTAASETVNASSSQVSTTVVGAEFGRSVGAVVNQLSTPRLREYFPETLVWQPSLETDKQGRAQLKFKLADNITTWKMSVIGSTEDGQIGTVEKEIKAFQPFFVEHDPPRILTEGDQISLPVVVRNYLDRAQTVNLEIKPESWFALLGPATRSVNVAAGDATRGTFDFRASASVKDGKQRITANGADANDAIEKPVTVHPDGEEKSVTASDVIADCATLAIDIPQTALPNSARAELKIYPNLMAHVAESVEAIMSRPYGCGEQTISSTYPSLLYLRHYKRMGPPATAGGSDSRARAERYLRAGYSRLLNYRDESGGFTYWGSGDPDLALTTYALRFLSEARELIAVDEDTIKQTRAWLVKQQRADGGWTAHDYGDKVENKRRTALLTAYVARVLAITAPSVKIDGTSTAKQQPFKEIPPELKRALDYLAVRVEEIGEPYLIASYALAALEVNDAGRAQQAIAKLRALAHEENGASYWSLETNTPFYGWGLAGRVETTALVVQALVRESAQAGSLPYNDELITRGLLFLLREKDRYGVWYSTQATINVLDALLVLLARDVDAARVTSTPAAAEIIVNGRGVKSVELPAPNRLVGPMTIDLSQFLQAGMNRVEIKRARGSSPASAQAVATYYLPWRESVATQNANWRANGSNGLRLITRFDRTESNVNDQITCHVEAERIGFSGYGMMLAEIGLPPGANVDRASLDSAMKGADWSISQYDILPDRVIVYLWPRAGGTKFDFKFRPRFGLNAQTAASIVYDYYNPEARAIVAPTRFVVK
jgi:A-macroglobulin complement component/carboxypeptidase family protein/alpha-2-macroglobulin family protein/MG2 domain-containing protein/A-macroglobulin receptor/macroglobulin-like protein